jgi:hypothetical protein
MRTFVVASGVWLLRFGYMIWGMTTGGLGSTHGMSGPFDIVWAFATYLLPLMCSSFTCALNAVRRSPNQ